MADERTVWKFPLQPGEQVVEMPTDAMVLTVGEDTLGSTHVAVWALVDPTASPERRRFVAVATGERFDVDGLAYVGTVHITMGGTLGAVFGVLVFHVFMEVTGE